MGEPLSSLRPYVVGLAKKPREMTRGEARAEFGELMARLPELTGYIEGVLEADGLAVSGPSEIVLREAGEWLVARARMVRVKSPLPARFGQAGERDLSVPTMSACCYVGILFGSLLVRDVPTASWVLVTENKRDIDYHRAVVRPVSNKTQVDPIQITMNFVRRRLKENQDRRSLSDLYAIWRSAVSPPA